MIKSPEIGWEFGVSPILKTILLCYDEARERASERNRKTMELLSGRPTDESGRLARETRVYDYLDGLGIEYQRTDHEAAGTME